MNYIGLTVPQLETLARRARERGHERATFYLLGGELLVEVVTPPDRPYRDGPAETVIFEDGSIPEEVPA